MTLTKRLVVLLAGGILAIALLFFIFGRIDALMGIRDNIVSDSSRAMVKIHGSVVKWRAKVAAAEQRQLVGAAAAHTTANELRITLVNAPLELRPVILAQIATADSTAYMKCSVVVLSCQQRAANAEAETDKLAKQLKRQLTVRDHRCGLFVGVGPVVYSNAGELKGQLVAGQVGLGCRFFRIPFLP